MKTSKFQALIGATATAIGLMASSGQANAFSLGSGATLSVGFECNNDMTTLVLGNNPSSQWQYVDDAVGDGSGGLHYELYGMGFMQDERYTYFVMNAYDMQKDAGQDTIDAKGKVTKYNIGWTDLLISTPGQSIANNNGSLMGIHFGANSAGVSQFGLYENVTANSLAKSHSGYDSVAGVLQHGQNSKPISLDEYLRQKGPEEQQAYQVASQQKTWSLSTYLTKQPQTVQQSYQEASQQKTWSLNTYLSKQPQTVQQAYQEKTWTFSTYLSKQPQTVQQAYQEKTWSFNTYLSKQPQTVQQAYQLATQQKNWSLSTYVSKQPQTVQQAYQLATQQQNWSLSTYLNSQPQAVKQAYNSGDQSKRDEITNAYNQTIAQAKQIVGDTQTAYNQFKQEAGNQVSAMQSHYQQFQQEAQTKASQIDSAYQQFQQDAQIKASQIDTAYQQFKVDAQTRASQIDTAYQQFKLDAQSRFDAIRAPYDRMASNFQNSLFGSLSNEQALNYFDTPGSGLIKSGTWVADIEMLNLEQLAQAGYNTNRFLGDQTIAFRIPRPIPEPTTLFGLAGIGLALASGKRPQRNS